MYLEIQRRLTPAEKFAQVLEFSSMALSAAEQAMRRQHPNASDREIFLRLVRRRLGSDLFKRVYGDELPDDEPPRPAP